MSKNDIALATGFHIVPSWTWKRFCDFTDDVPHSLYTPPVEADVKKEKPASEKTSAQLRSSIRRQRRYSGAPRQDAPWHPLPIPDLGQSIHQDLPPASAADRARLRRAERAARQQTAAWPAQLGYPWRASSNYDEFPATTYAAPEMQYATSSLRSTQANNRPSPHPAPLRRRPSMTASRAEPRAYVPEVTFADDVSRRSPGAADRPRSPSPLPQAPRWVPAPPRPPLSRSLVRHEDDGLGDRLRSLSPADGENLWDTLLTTVTPDPQPPSIGSSFASSRPGASRTATQTSAIASSRTSITGPEVHEDYEAAYESCYNSDSDHGEESRENDEQSAIQDRNQSQSQSQNGREEDGDVELFDYDLGRFVNRRSYAEVAATARDNNSSAADALELLSMQRIVRHLARREDIPDEWWAEAGLSRTLSREGEGEGDGEGGN
jgi:hypothetical protein